MGLVHVRNGLGVYFVQIIFIVVDILTFGTPDCGVNEKRGRERGKGTAERLS